MSRRFNSTEDSREDITISKGGIEQPSSVLSVRNFAVATASIAAGISGATLVGWLCHIPALIEPWYGQATMKANTAAALLLSAAATFALIFGRGTVAPGWKVVLQLAAGLVAMTGLLTLLEIVAGLSLGIDQLLSEDWGSQKGTSSRGRMGLNTAVSLLCLGLSQLLLALSVKTLIRKIAFALVFIVAAVAVFSLIGYLYGVPSLYKIKSFTEMALSTAIAIALLSAGILAGNPEEGPFALLRSRAGSGAIARRLLPTGILLPPLIGWAALHGQRSGSYPYEFGVAIVALSMMMAMIVLSCWLSHVLEREDTTRKYAEDLRASEEKYRSVTESANDAIISADWKGSITFVNAAFESIFGYSSTEARGKTLTFLMPERLREAHAEGLNRFVATGRARVIGKTVELAGVKKNGEEFPLELSLGVFGQGEAMSFTGIVRDITERKEAEQKFQSLLESAPDAMIITNESGEMIIVNSQAEKLFGFSRAELLGKKVEMLIPERLRNRHVMHRTTFFNDPHPRQMGSGMELYAVGKDGREIPVEISLGPLETEHGTLISAAIRDISERKMAEEQSRRLQLLSTRQDFLAALMHNLKNPIIGADRVLEIVSSGRLGSLPPELARIFSQLKESNRKLLSMMNELIEVYQYETDPRVLHPQPTDIGALVRSCINDCSTLSRSRQVELKTEVPDDLGLVLIDETGIGRVLDNLLDNAIKYSDEGGKITVSVRKNENTLEFSVHNYGRTISGEERQALFRGFWKGDAGMSRPPGTGLGLYLCKTIIDGHRGELACTSEEDSGTKFTVTLPI